MNTPDVPQNGAYTERYAIFQNPHLQMNCNPENGLVVKKNFKFLSKSPVKGAPSQAPNKRQL